MITVANLAEIRTKLDALEQQVKQASEIGNRFDQMQLLNIMSQHADREEHLRLAKLDQESAARYRNEHAQAVRDGLHEIAEAVRSWGGK